jgi:hypothetical protein
MDRKAIPTARTALSTGLYYPDEDKHMLRLSVWVNPEDCEVLEDNPDKPTMRVEVKRGRFTLNGSIDRKAYKAWLLGEVPETAPVVPTPTTVEPSSNLMRSFVR